MIPDARQGEALLAVIDAGSFEQAAAALHLTPSAVSQRVSGLESAVGAPLLIRSRPIRLTSAGQRLVQYLRRSRLMEQEFLAELKTDEAMPPQKYIEELRKRDLRLPVQGLDRDDLRDTFNEIRGGDRRHEALDILAPRDTPVLAVDDGTIAKLFLSKPGGITIYQFDPTATYAYYYAHLSRYAEGLEEHEAVERGQVIGYVGTPGNAPPATPHLHFAIFKLTDEKRWWQGTAIDPYPVLR